MSSQSQDWSPQQYRANAGYVAKLGKPVVNLLAPKPGERVLDLGCGDGALTRDIACLGCDVTGVDASAEMVIAARSCGIEARHGDGAALTFVDEFDAVFGNAALHWISPPEAVICGVWRALRPGGRFVGEFGGNGNVATIISAIDTALAKRQIAVACPWFFPTPADYSAMPERAGFVVHDIDLFPRPTPLPGDVRGWLETFAQHYINAVPSPQRKGLVSEVVDDLRNSIADDEGNWIADYIRLRFYAEKPPAST